MSMLLSGVVVADLQSAAIASDPAPWVQLVANRAIVCHVIDALRAAGVEELAVVAEPNALAAIGAAIEADDPHEERVRYLPQIGPRGLIGALATSSAFVGRSPCLIHSAVGVVGQPLTPLVDRFAEAQPDLMLLLHRALVPPDPLRPRTQRLIGVSELDGGKTRLGLAGACLLGPDVLPRICAEQSGTDSDSELSVVVERVAAGERRVEAACVETWHRYSGSPADLLELNRMILDRQSGDGDHFAGAGNRIEGRVVIHPTAEVTSSVVLGPSIIGPFARITNAYIGPYTSIGAGAEIEGAEIERSIILDEAKIIHVGGRIEASTVGRRASIMRDFGLPRATRLHVGADVEVALT